MLPSCQFELVTDILVHRVCWETQMTGSRTGSELVTGNVAKRGVYFASVVDESCVCSAWSGFFFSPVTQKMKCQF